MQAIQQKKKKKKRKESKGDWVVLGLNSYDFFVNPADQKDE